ncbi:MAG: FG-GAP-like repeat-containing protein, partial [Flavobacteriaceae bacterium]
MKRYFTTLFFATISFFSIAQDFQLTDFSSAREISSISNSTSGGVTRQMIDFGDFNSDGKIDLVKAGSNQIEILENIYSSGDISNPSTNLFSNLTPLSTPSNTRNVVVKDINNDGKLDILVGSANTASYFINNSSGQNISFENRVDVSSYGANVNLFDIDNDGFLDLIHSGESYFSKIGINLYDSSSNTFSNSTFDFNVTYGLFQDWVFGDFDSDGDLDFFSAACPYPYNSTKSGIYLAENLSSQGNINFGSISTKLISTMTDASYSGPRAVDVADIDGDNILDAVVQMSNKVYFFSYNNTGALDVNNFNDDDFVSQNSTSNFALNIGIGDIDKDNKVDIVLPGSNTSGTFVLKNKSTIGNVDFSNSVNVHSITNQTVKLVDLDGDNVLDIVSARYYSDKIYVQKYIGTLSTISLSTIQTQEIPINTPAHEVNDFTLSNFDSSDYLVSLNLSGASTETFTIHSTSSLTLEYGYSSWSTIQTLNFSGKKEAIENALNSLTVSSTASVGEQFDLNIFIVKKDAGYYYNPINGHLYLPKSELVNYSTAKTNAGNSTYLGQSGYLVTITSQFEQDFINDNTDSSNIWFAITDSATEGTWLIDDGPELGTKIYEGGNAFGNAFVNWSSGEPNNASSAEDHAVTKWNGGTQWNDIRESYLTKYIIEFGTWDSPENSSFDTSLVEQITFTTVKQDPMITFSDVTKTFGDAAFNLSATSSSTGAITYSILDSAVATVSGTTVTLVGAGTTSITLTQASDSNYNSKTVTATLTVNAAATVGEALGTWQPMIKQENFDPNDDQQAVSDTDLVGNASNAMLETQKTTYSFSTGDAQDEVYHFRVRLGDAHTNGKLGTSFYLALDLDTDNLANIFVEANVKDNTPFVAFHIADPSKAGTGPSNTGWLNSTNNTNIERELTSRDAFIQAYDATTDLDSNGETDSWIEFAFTEEAIKSFASDALGLSITGDSSIALYTFTSTSQTANGDIGGINDDTADLTKTWEELGVVINGSLNDITSNAILTPTINSTTFSSNTVTVTGTWGGDKGGTDTLTIELDGTTYSTSNGLSINNNNWALPATLSYGQTYTVTATTTRGSESKSGVATITIDLANIANATIATIPDQTYTGSAITVSPTVTFNGSTVTETTDYTVSITNNTNAGTASLTITGTGNFTGTKTVSFTIVKADPTISFSDVTKTYGESDFNLTATSSSTGAFTYTISDANVATVTGSTTTIVGVGSST